MGRIVPGSVSVDATATRALENSRLEPAECFIGDAKQAAQVIALPRVFFPRDYFGVFTWRINQTRNTLEVVFVGSPCFTRMGMVCADTHGLILAVALVHTSSQLTLDWRTRQYPACPTWPAVP